MMLDTDPFPVNVKMTNIEEKQVLVQTSQADMTVSDEPRLRMITPKSPKPGKWKINQGWQDHMVRPTSSM
jgi:hypothetical protein